jgi:hypothetical protein
MKLRQPEKIKPFVYEGCFIEENFLKNQNYAIEEIL